MKTRGLTLTMLMTAATVAGCSQSPSLVAPSSKQIPFTSESWVSTNYAATIQLYKTTTWFPDTVSGVDSEALVYLWDTTDNVPVSGGTVTMNSTTIPINDESAFGGGKYYSLRGGHCPFRSGKWKFYFFRKWQLAIRSSI